jgi:hypothetical protein
VKWSLSDVANLAQIISIPLTVLLWFFTKEHVAGFWKKWWRLIFSVLAVVTIVGAWRQGWFSWLTHSTALPIWVLILILFGGPLLGFIIWSVISSLPSKPVENTTKIDRSQSVPKQSTQPVKPIQIDWHNFVSDEIFGVLWRWDYYGNTINDRSLTAFCPRPGCMNRLESELDPANPNFGRQHYGFPETMTCHRCGFKHHFDCDSETVRRRVVNEIERLVNTGQYLQRIKGRTDG